MRIAIIAEKFPSHSETFIYNKVAGLCKRGHAVAVFRNAKHNDGALEKAYNLSALPNLTLVDMAINNTPGKMVRSVISNAGGLLQSIKKPGSFKKQVISTLRSDYFKKYPCDIYHFEFSGLAIVYQDLFENLPGKIVVSCRGSAEKVKPFSQPERIEQLRNLFTEVDAIHCVSADMSETIQQYGADARKIFINHPSIDAKVFTRTTTYSDKAEINILSIGRLSFQKGYLIGLLAFKKLLQAHPTAQWNIIGDGPSKEEIIFYINDLGLVNNVHLHGAKTRPAILQAYEAADIVFLPSVYEGLANVALEAMCMQVPVVSSNCSGMGEVIMHNVNGMLAANYMHSEMADHLLALCNNYDKRKTLGQAGRQTILHHFTIERQLDVFEASYAALVNHSN